MRKKLLAGVLIVCMALSALTGCKADNNWKNDTETMTEENKEEVAKQQQQLEEYFINYTSIKQPKKNESHYTFNLRAMNNLQKECGIEDIEKYWNYFIDALLAGETEFECPNEEVCQFICLSLLVDNLNYVNSGIDIQAYQEIVDGKAHFTYKVSKEEIQEQIDKQKIATETILNEVLEDDYTDFEKTLALYIYFEDNFTFLEDFSNCGMEHVLTEKQGICAEFAMTYSYLLTQAALMPAL